jgi:hypothetical protein
MRRSILPWAIGVFAAVMVYVAYRSYLSDVVAPLNQVQKIVSAPSKIYARLLIRYKRPPIYEEEYSTQDINGVTSYDYRIRTYSGRQVTITAPAHTTYDVSFFFGKLVQDGVWKIVNKPPRQGANAHYTVYVKQEVDFKQGDRTVTFTSPHYWATVPGRQYEIDLRNTNPSDLLKLSGTARNDPRYEKIVEDFRAFGPAEFRNRIAQIRRQLHAGPGAP